MRDVDDLLLAACVALVGALFASTHRLSSVVLVWAALLPIYSIGPVPPVLFDVARYGLAAAIGVRGLMLPPQPRWQHRRWWVVALLVLGVWLAVAGYSLSDPRDTRLGVTILLSVGTATFALMRLPNLRPVLNGYAAGAVASSVVLVASAAGSGAAAALVPIDDSGFMRHTGLGSGATSVASELAVGAVILGVFAVEQRRGRVWRMIAAVTCLAGVLLSGGRGGLAMVLAAGLWLLLRGRLRPVAVVTTIAFALAAGGWLAQQGIALNTLERLTGATTQQYGFTTGRVDLNARALQVTFDGFLPEGTTQFLLFNYSTPHFAPLTFGVAGGVPAFAIGLVLVLALFRELIRDRPTVAVGILAALAAYTLVEPLGPFVGLSSVTLLLTVLVSRQGPSRKVSSRVRQM